MSVLLPTWNSAPQSLDRSVQSLIAQTWQDWACWVIDDHSDPPVQNRWRDKRVNVLRYSNTEGPNLASALNYGLAMSLAPYVARQDVGDWSHPQRLQKAIQQLTEHPHLGMVACLDDGQTGEARLASLVTKRNAVVHGSVVIRRKWLMRAGGYDPHYLRCQDWELWLRLMEEPAPRVGILDPSLYVSAPSSTASRERRQWQRRVRWDAIRAGRLPWWRMLQ